MLLAGLAIVLILVLAILVWRSRAQSGMVDYSKLPASQSAHSQRIEQSSGAVSRDFRPDIPLAEPASDSRAGPYRVILTDSGRNKINVIKVVRSRTGVDLKQAKDLVESVPQQLLFGVTRECAQALVDELTAAGARAIVDKSSVS